MDALDPPDTPSARYAVLRREGRPAAIAARMVGLSDPALAEHQFQRVDRWRDKHAPKFARCTAHTALVLACGGPFLFIDLTPRNLLTSSPLSGLTLPLQPAPRGHQPRNP